MAESHEQKRQRLINEKYIIMQDMARPGFQLILTKLDDAAQKMLLEYDNVNFEIEPEKALRIQIYREVVLAVIPQMMEAIMNADTPEREPKWRYGSWLRSIKECIAELITYDFRSKLAGIFNMQARP